MTGSRPAHLAERNALVVALWNNLDISGSEVARRCGVTWGNARMIAKRYGAKPRPPNRFEMGHPQHRKDLVERRFKGYAELTRTHECCWPEGCVLRPLPGKSYCAEHHALAYQPLKRKS